MRSFAELDAYNRRRRERVQTRLPVCFGTTTPDRRAYAQNISEGGLYLLTNDVFRVGTQIVVAIEFPDRVIVRHDAEVMWGIHVPDHLRDSLVHGMGVHFLDPDPQWPKFFSEWKDLVAG